MSNDKQQTSLDYFLDSFIKNGVSLSPFYLGKFREAKEMYNDEMEAVIIKHCAEIGTSNASAYSDGYKQGYHRAIENAKYQINKWIDKELKITQQ